jgi:hypothetical protein
MSTAALRIHRPYRYRPVPIRAAFVPCRCNLSFYLQCRREIGPFQPATDPLGNGIASTTDLIVNSCQHAPIQITIAKRPSMTTAKHPAVSSLEAYPTPAH